MENLHDRRKQIEVIWQARKTQVEQCLALALLAIELLEIENLLKARRESLTKNKQLGDSKASAQLLLEEIRKTLVEAKVVIIEQSIVLSITTDHICCTMNFRFRTSRTER